MYKEYLAEFWYSAKALENSKVSFSIPTGGIYGEVGVNTFRNVIGAHYLPRSSEYIAPPSIDIVRKWFESIGYGEIVSVKGTLKKSLLPPRWRHHHQTQQETKEKSFCLHSISISVDITQDEGRIWRWRYHMLVICSEAKPVVFKAPKLSSNAERLSQGTKPGAQPGHKKHSTFSKQPFVSNKEAIKASFIIHSESASRYDASANSTTEVDPGKSSPSDFIPKKHGMNEGTKNTSYDHLFTGTNPHVLAHQTQSVSEGLETVLNQSTIDKGANNIAKQIEEVEASSTIKLEDLAKLVQNVQPSFKDLDSLEDDPIIVVDDSDEDEEADKDRLHATSNIETKDASVPKSSSPRSSQIQELTNQVLILQSQKHKLELKMNKDEAEAALLKAQPSFPNVGQLNELQKQVHELEIELPGDLKEIPTKLEDFTKTATSLTSQVAKLKTLQWELLVEFHSVPTQVEMFAQAIALKKTEDTSIPSAGQADTQPAEGEKNTNQTTIS
ncbi:hypothetical protein Tco_0887171 [Tanacetum coccineum]